MKFNHPADGALNPSVWFNSPSWEWFLFCSLSGKVVQGEYSFTYIKGLKCAHDEGMSSDFFFPIGEKLILTDAGEYFKRTLKGFFWWKWKYPFSCTDPTCKFWLLTCSETFWQSCPWRKYWMDNFTQKLGFTLCCNTDCCNKQTS